MYAISNNYLLQCVSVLSMISNDRCCITQYIFEIPLTKLLDLILVQKVSLFSYLQLVLSTVYEMP